MDSYLNLAGVVVDARYVAQDLKNGIAMRRLLEALPEWAEVRLTVEPSPGRRVAVVVVEPPDDAFGFGDTFAEAADKCLEAVRS